MLCRKCGAEVPDAPYCCACGWKQTNNPERRSKRGNGQGRVWKRGKVWYAQITLYSEVREIDGQKHYRQKKKTKGGFKTKKEALDYIPLMRGSDGRKIPTLLELYSVWEENDLPKLSTSKRSGYKKARERLDELMGRRIDELTTSELQEIVNRQATSYYTARDMKTLLSHLYNKALPDRFVPSNLAQYIILPELDEKEAEPFTEDEVNAMWAAFADGDVFVGYLLLMIYSGMMPGELMACKKDMVDMDRCEIWGCGKKTKKRKKETPIVFPVFLRPVLSALMEIEVVNSNTSNDKLLTMNKDNFYKTYYDELARLEIRTLPPYSCRHTTGTEAARINLSAPVIQNIMRHSKITTTQKYIHLGSEEAHRGVNQMKKSN